MYNITSSQNNYLSRMNIFPSELVQIFLMKASKKNWSKAVSHSIIQAWIFEVFRRRMFIACWFPIVLCGGRSTSVKPTGSFDFLEGNAVYQTGGLSWSNQRVRPRGFLVLLLSSWINWVIEQFIACFFTFLKKIKQKEYYRIPEGSQHQSSPWCISGQMLPNRF